MFTQFCWIHPKGSTALIFKSGLGVVVLIKYESFDEAIFAINIMVCQRLHILISISFIGYKLRRLLKAMQLVRRLPTGDIIFRRTFVSIKAEASNDAVIPTTWVFHQIIMVIKVPDPPIFHQFGIIILCF